VERPAAVFDACVLYPAALRDLLMWLALADLFRAKWTDRIHDEWIRGVLASRPDLKPEQMARTRSLMNAHVRDCLVTGYEHLVPTIELPDGDDRHVVAAAIVAGADTIVTFNLRDFPADELSKYGLVARHPDDFIVRLLGLSQTTVCQAARQHRASLIAPTKTPEAYLATLESQRLPQTAAILRKFSQLI
jgi:hypothetical protein